MGLVEGDPKSLDYSSHGDFWKLIVVQIRLAQTSNFLGRL